MKHVLGYAGIIRRNGNEINNLIVWHHFFGDHAGITNDRLPITICINSD